MVGNRVDDKYKKDGQPQIHAPNSCARNSLVDKYHNGSASLIALLIGLKGQECDKSRRQKRRIYFK